MIERTIAYVRRGLPRALVALLILGGVGRSGAAEPEPPSKDFLEYLGTIEAEDDDWTIFDPSRASPEENESPSPAKQEKSPKPPAGDER
jgi:hypothetical protein